MPGALLYAGNTDVNKIDQNSLPHLGVYRLPRRRSGRQSFP